jgi:hypothetical protein
MANSWILSEDQCAKLGCNDYILEEFANIKEVIIFKKGSFCTTYFDGKTATYECIGQSRYCSGYKEPDIISVPSPLKVQKYAYGNGLSFPGWATQKLNVKIYLSEEHYNEWISYTDFTYVNVEYLREEQIFIMEIKPEYIPNAVLHVNFSCHNYGPSIKVLLRK